VFGATLATLAAVAFAAIALAGMPSAAVWSPLTPGDCQEYCEASTRCGPLAERAAVQQPLNAWSNAAFLFVGLLALRRPRKPTAWLFALSCIALAVGSFLFHATVTREMQWLDMVGTYAALVAVLASGAVTAFGLPALPVVAAALVADALFAAYKWAISAWIALPLLMAAASVPIALVASRGERSVRSALAPGLLLAVALLARQLDVAGIACDPESRVWQGHALWHVLTAASLGCAFSYLDRRPA
jgi:hypothetical protein